MSVLQEMHRHSLRIGINDPVFPNPGPLVKVELRESINAAGRVGKYFNHQIRRTMYAVPIYLAMVTYHHQIRLYYRTNIFWAVFCGLKQSHIKWSGIDIAPLTLQIIANLKKQGR